MSELTYAQKQVYRVVSAAAAAGEVTPTNVEIADRAGLRAVSKIKSHLQALKHKGLISYTSGRNWRSAVTITATGEVTRERRCARGKKRAAAQDGGGGVRAEMKAEASAARGRGHEDFLDAIEKRGCLYITGDPLTRHYEVCARPRQAGSRWCRRHHDLCTIRPVERCAVCNLYSDNRNREFGGVAKAGRR